MRNTNLFVAVALGNLVSRVQVSCYSCRLVLHQAKLAPLGLHRCSHLLSCGTHGLGSLPVGIVIERTRCSMQQKLVLFEG